VTAYIRRGGGLQAPLRPTVRWRVAVSSPSNVDHLLSWARPGFSAGLAHARVKSLCPKAPPMPLAKPLIFISDAHLDEPEKPPGPFRLFGLTAVPSPPRHFELEPRFLGLDGLGAVLDPGSPFFGRRLMLRPFLLRASPRPPRVGIISPS
jgi:hypothetical protein